MIDLVPAMLRVLHIGGGIFWVGSTLLFFAGVEPTAATLGADGQRFVHHLVRRRIVHWTVAAATLTVATGIPLYWRASGGLQPAWMTSPTGLALTAAGVLGITTWLLGLFAIAPATLRLDAVEARIAETKAPDRDELMRSERLSSRLRVLGFLDLAMLVIVVIAMASARSLG